MTLLDVMKLVRHYARLCVAIVVVCTLLGAALGFSKSYLGNEEYSAESVLTASEPTATVSASELMPIVQATANNVIAANTQEGVSVSAEYDLVSRSITFTAVAASEMASIEAANSTAQQTAEETKALLATMAEQYRAQQADTSEPAPADGGVTIKATGQDRASALESVSFTINDASQAAANSGKSTLAKFALVGLLGGLFLAICVVVVIDLVKTPIKGREDVEKAFEIPVLADEAAGNFAQRLWANIQFAADAEPRSVCLVPAGIASSQKVQQELQSAVSQKGLQLAAAGGQNADRSADVSILACAPLAQDMATAFAARESDATVVLATQWQDSLGQLQDTLRELGVANAKVVGVALLTEKK